MDKQYKVTIEGDAAQLLEELASIQGIELTEALKKAIGTERFLLDKRLEGFTILLFKGGKDGVIREVEFKEAEGHLALEREFQDAKVLYKRIFGTDV